jgi:hypothetical protein
VRSVVAQGPRVEQPEAGDSTPAARDLSTRTVALCLVAIAALSSLLRIGLASRVHGPTVFMDELGYQRLAQSIGLHGRLELFTNPGLSYSPLYPAVLSPIYALGVSAPTAYDLAKVVNAILISLSVFPIYRIARFVLPRSFSLLTAGLAAVAPLMTYSVFTMSESLAYPLCLLAVWAMLAAIRAPGLRADALLLGAILVATLARIQLVVLVPVALTAVLLVGALGRDEGESAWRSLARRVREHALLFGVVAAGLALAAVAALAGQGVYSLGGRYANVGTSGLPSLRRVVEQLVEHLAGLVLALGVVPFVGALVAGYAFVRAGTPRRQLPFAAVAVSLAAWLLLETAYDAARFDGGGGDVRRIHERFLIYVVPLFLVALLAAYRMAERRASARVYGTAAVVTALLPALIPYHTVVNNTISVDTFGLQLVARTHGGRLVAVPHAALVAVWVSATFGLLYVRLHTRLRSVVLLVLIAFVAISSLLRIRIESGGNYARSVLPRHVDWVDRAKPRGDVVIVTGAGPAAPALETAFRNGSVARAYAICNTTFGPDFGEERATIDRAGQLRDPSGRAIRASYAVVPAALGVRGRVLARNPAGRQVLVAPADGRLSVPPAKRHVDCGAKGVRTA